MKKLILSSTAASTFLLLSPANAITTEVGKFYTAPSVGALISNGTGYKASPEISLGVGYIFTKYFSLKAGGMFFNAKNKDTNSNKLGTYTNVGAIFSLPTGTNLTPYMAGNIGLLNQGDTHFAPSLGLGATYSLSSDFGITLNYRLIVPMGSNASGTVNTLDAGVIYYLGG